MIGVNAVVPTLLQNVCNEYFLMIFEGLRLRGTDLKPVGSRWGAGAGAATSPQPILHLLQYDPWWWLVRTHLQPGHHLTAVISNEMRHRVPPPQGNMSTIRGDFLAQSGQSCVKPLELT